MSEKSVPSGGITTQRVLRGVLIGAAAVAAALAFALAFGTDDAHADELHDGGSLPVAPLVDHVAGSLGSTVDHVAAAVAPAPAAPVAQPARPAPAPARPAPAVTPLVSPVAATVDRVVASLPVVPAVTEPLLGPAPATGILTPVTGLVADLGGTAEGTVGGALDSLSAATQPVLPRDSASDALRPAAPAPAPAPAGGTPASERPAPGAVAGSVPPGTAPRTPAPEPGALGGGVPGSSSSPGGGQVLADTADGVRLTLAHALGARPSSDARPSTPVYDTDSSPD